MKLKQMVNKTTNQQSAQRIYPVPIQSYLSWIAPHSVSMTKSCEHVATSAEIASARKIVQSSRRSKPRLRVAPALKVRPAQQLAAANTWLRDYAKAEGIPFIDYYAAMVTPNGGMKRELTEDGVHPNKRGYDVMQTAAAPTLRAALK